MTINNTFLTKLAKADTEVLTKNRSGFRTGTHTGDVYINRQGRLFGITAEHDAWYDIEHGVIDNTPFIKVRPAQPTGKDSNGKDKYDETKQFKTSTKDTGTAFITVTKLCKVLFGKDKNDWARDFEKQGEQDGYTYYTLLPVAEKTVAKTEAKTAKKTENKTAKKTK